MAALFLRNSILKSRLIGNALKEPIYRCNVNLKTPALINAFSPLNKCSMTTNTSNSTSKIIEGEIMPPKNIQDCPISKDLIKKVNEQISDKSHGRLFAVISCNGKQFRVTPEDIIMLSGRFDADIGEEIIFEKINMCASKDFTLIGRPLLSKDLVRIKGTVIEKTLSHTKVGFVFVQRENNFRKYYFNRIPLTFIRINTVKLLRPVDEKPDIEGVEGRIF